jgi:hypothetical protein
MRPLFAALATISVVSVLALFTACGGDGSGNSFRGGGNGSGLVSTSMSDPATCTAPLGLFRNVFVTVRDVKAHVNASAPDNDPGFVDLTPGMTPVQIDLLGTANPQCVLAQLGTNVSIAPGTYQQVRIFLLDNTQTQVLGSNNQCGTTNGVNCVVLNSDGSTHQLNLSSEATTGIKLTGGQISGGSFTVSAGQSANLNLDFNACASVVQQSDGQFRLKPVLHAGLIGPGSNNAITGRVVDSVGLAAISGRVIVALEQRDSAGVDRIVMEASPDGAGNFILCPVPAGTYEVVATALDALGVAYAATVTAGVQPGASLGNVPLVAQPGGGSLSSPATINGTVNTTGASGATVTDVVLSAMQNIVIPGPTPTSPTISAIITVPLLAENSSTVTVITQAGSCVNASSACINYSLLVPAANPNVGLFNASGTAYSQDTTSPVAYTVDGQAFVPSSPSTPSCTPSEVRVNTNNGGGPLTVTGGATTTAATMDFSACQ